MLGWWQSISRGEGVELSPHEHERYFQTEAGLALGAGAFVSALEYSADCKAEVTHAYKHR